MPFSKLCPICRANRIYRKEVKTCGAPECIATWRSFNSEDKALAINKSEEINTADLSDWIRKRTADSLNADPDTEPPPLDQLSDEPIVAKETESEKQKALDALNKIFKQS